MGRRQRRRLEQCQHEGCPSVTLLQPSLIHVQQWIKFFTCLCMFACSTVLSDWLTVITDCIKMTFLLLWKISEQTQQEQTLLSLQRKLKIWDLIWDLSLEDSRFEEKMGFEIWDLVKWFKSVYWMIWDLTMRFDLGFAHHWIIIIIIMIRKFITCTLRLCLDKGILIKLMAVGWERLLPAPPVLL